MKFHGPFRKHGNIFAEVMSAPDMRLFDLACTKGAPGDTHKIGEARGWCGDVITLWSEKVELPIALGNQVVSTGGIDVVRRHFGRRHDKLMLEHQAIASDKKLSEEVRAHKLEQLNKVLQATEQVTHMDHSNLANWLREHWVWALSLRQPTRKVHDFSGKIFLKADAKKEKVGDKPNNPNLAKPKKPHSKPVVVKKGDREVFTPAEMAAMGERLGH